MDKQTEQDRYVGIDVGKQRIEVHVRPGGITFGCATDVEGLGYLITRLKPHQPKVIVLEATAVTKPLSPPSCGTPICQSPSSIRARRVSSLALWVSSPNPIASTPA